MKKSILFICLTFPFLLIGQVKSSISGIIGVDYSNRILNNSNFNGEKGKLNYRLGVNYNRKLSEKLWLESGLRFSSIGYKGLKMKGLIYASDLDPITGAMNPDLSLPRQMQFIYNYLFLEIPIGIRYELKQNKFKTYFAVSISPNIYLTTRNKTITELYTETQVSPTIGINKLTLSANIGYGFEYALSDIYQVYGQPSLRYHFTTLANGPTKEYLYNFGLELGFRKNLK